MVAAHRDAVKRVIAESIGGLSDKERLVVSLMYLRNLLRGTSRGFSVSVIPG